MNAIQHIIKFKTLSRHVYRDLLISQKSRCLSGTVAHTVKSILNGKNDKADDDVIKVSGWVENKRKLKKMSFLNLNDGSCAKNLQIVTASEKLPAEVSFGSCVEVTGKIVSSPGPKQPIEIDAQNIRVLGICEVDEYPFKLHKLHPPDYMREFIHLRPKTNYFGNLLRVRNTASMAMRNYFQENDFCEIQTPIITGNDCEGGG